MRLCRYGQESEDPARSRRSGSAGGVDRQWQHAAEACPARPDRGPGRRRYRNRRDSASIGGEQADHSALADALCRGRRGRLVPRQDAAARQGAAGDGGGQSGAREDADRDTAARHPLESAYDGQGGGHRAVERWRDLEGAWLEAASCGDVQAVERSAISRRRWRTCALSQLALDHRGSLRPPVSPDRRHAVAGGDRRRRRRCLCNAPARARRARHGQPRVADPGGDLRPRPRYLAGRFRRDAALAPPPPADARAARPFHRAGRSAPADRVRRRSPERPDRVRPDDRRPARQRARPGLVTNRYDPARNHLCDQVTAARRQAPGPADVRRIVFVSRQPRPQRCRPGVHLRTTRRHAAPDQEIPPLLRHRLPARRSGQPHIPRPAAYLCHLEARCRRAARRGATSSRPRQA